MMMLIHLGNESLIVKKLFVSIVGALHVYYVSYMHKKTCIVSYNTWMRWLTEVLG